MSFRNHGRWYMCESAGGRHGDGDGVWLNVSPSESELSAAVQALRSG